MSIPVHFRIFALILLSVFFAALLTGCGGKSISLFQPIGESQVDLVVAKSFCESRVYGVNEIDSDILNRGENIETLLQPVAVDGVRVRDAVVASPATGVIEGMEGFQNLARAMAEAQRQKRVFCACMAEYGWRCAGEINFRDVNSPITNAQTGLPDGVTPMHIFALNNNADTVYGLIAEGADVNVKDNLGATPLHYVAKSKADPAESAEALLKYGAKVDARIEENDGTGKVWDNWKGASPLHVAASNDNYEVAALLVKAGADVNLVVSDDVAPLHIAVFNNARKVAGLLISEGADIEAQGGDNGMTPLHYAAFSGIVEVADLLIARGANLDAKTYADETPLDIAKREGKRDVVALLERAVRAAARKTENADDQSDSANSGGDAESVFENAWRSVVVVVAGDSQGGGVVINEPNQVATNCHVVDKSPNDIRVYRGENRRAVRDAPHSAEIVSGDRKRDVCILSVPGLWAIPAKIRPVAELEIGEAVYAVGTPRGLDFSISNGIVSQLREGEDGNAPLIQTSAAISPGSSGGGLFDSQGRLVGLTTWKIREGENLNFAIPVDWVLELAR